MGETGLYICCQFINYLLVHIAIALKGTVNYLAL